MGRLAALALTSALALAACGSQHSTVLIDTTPETAQSVAATAPTTTSMATTTTAAAATATSTTLSESQKNISALVGVLSRIGDSDPFGPEGESFHFEAELTMLDVDLPAPTDRTTAQFITVLGVVGDASPTTAAFTVSDATSTRSGLVVDGQVWTNVGSVWEAMPVTDAHAEVRALSYGNWTQLLVQMVSLTAQFTTDTTIDVASWSGGDLYTITASAGPTDTIMAAGLPSATQLWVDDQAVVHKATVQGYIVWSGVYVPATLTIQLDPMPEPVIVAPTEGVTLSS